MAVDLVASDRHPVDPLALEVRDSCATGDHNNVSYPSLRALVGYAALFFGALAVPSRAKMAASPMLEDTCLFVAANPVAHGARLAVAVRSSVRTRPFLTVADGRLAESGVQVDVNFPGVSARSLLKVVTLARLGAAFRIRRLLPRDMPLIGSASRFYREYVFLAQAIRYNAIESLLRRQPNSVTVLTDFDRSAYARPWVWAARRSSSTSVTLMHGSPNMVNYIPVLADYAFAWGRVQKAWIEENSPLTKVKLVGRPDLTGVPVGCSGAIERVIICHSKELLSSTELSELKLQLRMFRAQGATVFLKLHPSCTPHELDGEWTQLAHLADEVITSRASFSESLLESDLVVCISSSAAIEALASGVATIVIADADRVLPSDLERVKIATPLSLHAIGQNDARGLRELIGELAGDIVAARGAESQSLLDVALASAEIRRRPPNNE